MLQLVQEHTPCTSTALSEDAPILKGAGNNKTITASDLQPQMEQLLVSLFNCLRMEGSLENEYVMKAIMRSMATMGDKIAPLL